MTDRVDYEIDQDFDIGFTEWNDIRTVHDDRVLTQNFVFLAAEVSNELVGEQLTATKLSRFKRRLERNFRESEDVDYFAVNEVELDDRELTYDITVGSDDYVETVRIP